MAMIDFGIEGIGKMDAAILAAVNKRIEDAGRDCVDRPNISAARTVTVAIKISPKPDGDGMTCERVETSVSISSAIPPASSRSFEMEVRPNGKMRVNGASPDDVRQHTLDEADQD